MAQTQPNRVDHKAVSCIADGIELPRVQSVSFSGDIPFEDALELANNGVVERVYDVPDITMTVTTWDTSTDTLAVLNNMWKAVEPTSALPALLNAGAGLGTDTVYLGADAPAAKESAFDVSTGSVPIATDFLIHKKTQGTNTIDECLHLSKCFLNSWGLSWSTDGQFEQSFDLDVTNIHRYIGTSAKYMHIATHVPSASTRFLRILPKITTGNTDQATSANSTGVPLVVIHNDLTYRSNAFFGNDAGGAGAGSTTASNAGKYNMQFISDPNQTGGDLVLNIAGTGSDYTDPTFATNDFIRILYAKAHTYMPFGALSTTYYTNLPGSIKGPNTVVALYPRGETSAQMLRVQSIDVDVPFDREELTQIGANLPYFQALTLPLSIGLSISVMTSDLRHWADALTDSGTTTTVGAGFEFDHGMNLDISFDKLNVEFKCKIDNYKSKTDYSDGQLITTYILNNMRWAGADEDYSVGDNASTTLNFVTDRMTVLGNGF